MAEQRSRVVRVQRLMRVAGVQGRWQVGTSDGPGRLGTRRRSYLWGPDGFVLAVAGQDARALMRNLNAAGVRRPVIIQTVNGTDHATHEVARVELSDFLEMLAVYTEWLAKEGRLGDNE